jgi:nucleoside-diphosphate-sugar epimerase
MRVLVLGGTRFIGRRITERLVERGDDVLVVHRGRSRPEPWVAVGHLHVERHRLGEHADRIRAFDPDAVVDTFALTAADVEAVTPVLPRVPTVVLSSQDVYQAYAALRAKRCDSPVPITEESETRRERYPYRGAGLDGVPEDYEKLDVERRWLDRGATVLRLPLVYGAHDWQRREEPILRRVRAGREQIPVGAANLLWTRAHVDDIADGALAALDIRAADGQAVNLGETATVPVHVWFTWILDAACSAAQLVQVPDAAVPADLIVSTAALQHLLVSVARARELLGWAPADPAQRVAGSVRWHLAHPPPEPTWTEHDSRDDDAALASSE